jgi:hypothetical protein
VGGKDWRPARAGSVLQAAKAGSGETPAPQADGVITGAQFRGDLQVGRLVLVGGAEDDADAANEDLRGRVSANQALQVLSLLVRKDQGRRMGCRHGGSPVVVVGLAFLLFAIRTPIRHGYEKTSMRLTKRCTE